MHHQHHYDLTASPEEKTSSPDEATDDEATNKFPVRTGCLWQFVAVVVGNDSIYGKLGNKDSNMNDGLYFRGNIFVL